MPMPSAAAVSSNTPPVGWWTCCARSIGSRWMRYAAGSSSAYGLGELCRLAQRLGGQDGSISGAGRYNRLIYLLEDHAIRVTIAAMTPPPAPQPEPELDGEALAIL